MSIRKILFTLLLILTLNIASAQVDVDISLVEFASGFDKPVDIINAGDDRLFIVEKDGLIRILNSDGTINAEPFLDMQSQTSTGGLNSERGLLGLAFHPQYQENGYFYVNYTRTNGDTRISRFSVSADDEDIADFDSREDVMTIYQPYGNHNGGCIKFGPDGYLYIGMGDGGSGEDPDNYGQSMDELLGKMLRIDVDGGTPYAVPSDNPYVNTGSDTLPEIWAAGLRNPWRFSFDSQTGDLWMGDVGQYAWEEIDFQPASSTGGENYGWRCYEGNHPGFGGGCPPIETFDGPVAEFPHSAGHCSVTGGFVYRGDAFPELFGKYFYADYCSGQFWSLEQNDADEWVEFFVTGTEGFGWTTFGEDYLGELYLANQTGGVIYKLIMEGCGLNNVSINQDGGLLIASQAAGYQWYLNGEAIPFATDQAYEPTESGSYTVLADFGDGCADFSETLTVIQSSVDELQNAHSISLLKNPIQYELALNFGENLSSQAEYRIYDVMGKEILSGRIPAGVNDWNENVSEIVSGNYTMSLTSKEGISSIRFTVAR